MVSLKSSNHSELSGNQEQIKGLPLLGIKIFKFFASLKLAVLVIVTLMIVLAVGTIIESLHGTTAAQVLVYHTSWFGIILFLLAANLAAAALDRLPWKVRHVGFVVTHLGIILILLGSFTTQRTVIDGQISLAEGETESYITLSDPILFVHSGKSHGAWYFDLKKRAFAWTGEEKISSASGVSPLPFEMKILADYPKAALRESVRAAEAGEPGIQIKVHNSFVDEQQWLLQNHPQIGEMQMGPVKLKFTDQLLQDSKEGEAPKSAPNYLEFQFPEKIVQVPLKTDQKLPAELTLPGTPYKIQLLRVLKNAAVKGKELVEQPEGEASAPAKNPAAEFILSGPDVEEKHTVFANFPDFPTVHGMKPSSANVKIYYRNAAGGSKGENHEIRFAVKEGKLFCQIIQGAKVSTREVKKGEEITTGWMGGLTVKVAEFYVHAEVEQSFTPEPNSSENPQFLPAIQIQIHEKDKTRKLWLRQGVSEELQVAGEPFTMIYTQKRIPAPFKLQLKDFRLENYPGTDRPASFESDVVLKDDSRGVMKQVEISMNEPLEHRGFKIYQSGYSINPGEPEVSVFSVGKDPGIPLKYVGAIVLIGGLITMYYTRRYSSTGKTL